MRFILVTFFSLLFVGIVLFAARIWGDGQTFPIYEHGFFKENQELTVLKVTSLEQAQAAVQEKPDVVIWLDVRISQDNILYVLSPSADVEFLNFIKAEQEKHPDQQIMTGGKLTGYTWEKLKSFYKDAALLKEYYEKLPQTRFVVNIVDNVLDVHAFVNQVLEPLNPGSRTLIQSDTLVIMTSVKALRPEWLYGTGTADLMRLLSFDSLWILSSVQFKGDVFISPFKLLKRPAFNDAGIAEMRRRHKRVLLGPIENATELAEARRLKADGLIVNDLNFQKNM